MRQQLKVYLLALSFALAVTSNALSRKDPTFTRIDFPEASFTDAQGINPRGDIVGQYMSGGMTHGYLLSGGEFASIDFPGASTTFARGINSHGDIVGLYVSGGVTHGFLLSGGEFASIDFPGASFTAAREINSRGDIVGRYDSSGVTHGFLLSGGEFASIDFPGASFTVAFGINARGDIVGTYSIAGVNHAFLLSGGSFTTVDFPGASDTFGGGINPRGDIVGRYTSAGVNHGFLLSSGEFASIDFPGASFVSALEINPRGDIVGFYVSSSVTHGFLLRRRERDEDKDDDGDSSEQALGSAEGGGHRASTIFVDSHAGPNGDGSASAPFQTITLAVQQGRQIRTERQSRIIVRVAPGEYVEDFPIYLNISNLELRGSTRLIEDDSGELPGNCGTEGSPAPCVEPGTETLIIPLVPLPIGRSLFTVGPTKDNPVANLTNITISGFIFDGKGDNVTATSGRSIFVDRTANFIIDHNVLRHGAPALTTRMSSGSIESNFAYDDVDGFAVAAGSEIYPARVKLVANRSINVTVNGSMGALATGTAPVGQVDPNLEPVQSVYDPSLHPEQVPDRLVIFVIGNDFSRNMLGFRFEQYNTFYDTTDNQPMTANFRAIVRNNLCRNNAEYGFLVEGAFAPISNPRKFTGTFKGSFEDNDCSGTGRAGVFVGFMLNGVVTRNPGLIKTYKYLHDSSFILRLDDVSLSSGLDYDNPDLDPADKQTPLNNQLTINGDTFTGKRVTCPPGFPCVP